MNFGTVEYHIPMDHARPVLGRILGVRRHEDSLFDISKQNAVKLKQKTELLLKNTIMS